LKPIRDGGSFEDFGDDAFDSDEELIKILEVHGVKLGGGKQLPGVTKLVDVELLNEALKRCEKLKESYADAKYKIEALKSDKKYLKEKVDTNNNVME
jgi:hypothetical protein